MDKYIKIIQTALQKASATQNPFEAITEQTAIKIIATIDVAMEYLADNYIKAFHDVVNAIRFEAKNNGDILNMMEKLMETIDIEKCSEQPAPVCKKAVLNDGL
jgi:hypothetical protein